MSCTFRERLENILSIQESTSVGFRQTLEESLSKQDRTYSMAQRRSNMNTNGFSVLTWSQDISDVFHNTTMAYWQEQEGNYMPHQSMFTILLQVQF